MAKISKLGKWIFSAIEKGIRYRVLSGCFPYTGSAEI